MRGTADALPSSLAGGTLPVGRHWKMVSLLVRLCPGPGVPTRTVSGRNLAPAPRPQSPGPHGEEMLNTAEAGQQFRPWPPWSMVQLTPQGTQPEEGGKRARGQPLLGLPVRGTWLEGHSAPLSPEPDPLCRAAIPLQGRPLGEAGASLSWAAVPTDHGSKATQHHCLPRACPPPCPWLGRDPHRGGTSGRRGCG